MISIRPVASHRPCSTLSHPPRRSTLARRGAAKYLPPAPQELTSSFFRETMSTGESNFQRAATLVAQPDRSAPAVGAVHNHSGASPSKRRGGCILKSRAEHEFARVR